MLFVVAPSAFAQSTFEDAASPALNAQRFRPTLTPHHFLWVDEVGLDSDPTFHADALFHYTNDPLVYEYADGTIAPLVTDVLEADVSAGGRLGPFRLGVVLPVYLLESGVSGQGAGLGDLGIDARLLPLTRDRAPVGLSLGGRLYAPTATVDTLANGEAAWELSAAVDGAVGPVLLALDLGTRGGPEVALEDVVLNDAFLTRAGASFAIDDRTGVGLETDVQVPYGTTLGKAGVAGWEWLASGYRRLGDWQLRGGFGSGLTHAVGSPDLRVLLGLGWRVGEPAPAAVVVDGDGDGLLDPADACLAVPEDADGFEDGDGCPEVDDDRDGVADADDACRQEPEDLDQVRDADGCPEPEVAVDLRVVGPDGVVVELARTVVGGGSEPSPGGATRHLELPPGTFVVEASAAGFEAARRELVVTDAPVVVELVLTPAASSRLTVSRDRIDLKESVSFETASATIKAESFPLLEQVAQVLRDYPEIAKLRVEGHTDSRGNDAYNLKLSADRAAAVRQWLIDHGIAADRLASEGFGETRPLDPREVAEAWAKNRRVDLTVESWVEQPR